MSAPQIHITESGNNIQLNYNGKPLYHGQHPRETIIRRINHTSIHSHTAVLIFSPILWIGIENLLQRCSHDQLIIILEFDYTLAALARTRMPAIIQNYPRAMPIIPTTDSDIETALLEIQNSNIHHIETIALSGGYRLYHERYRNIIEKCHQLIHATRYNRITAKHLGRLWIRNMLKNLYFDYNIADISACQIYGPIIVVGAGCSLEADIDALRQLRASHTIMAVDTAWPILSMHGIHADIIVVTEAQCYNMRDFIGTIPNKTVIIADITSHPSTTRALGNRILRYTSHVGELGLFTYLSSHHALPHLIPGLGSVGVIATYLALMLSTDLVYTVGFDFCYQLGKSHARGAPFMRYNAWQSHRLDPNPLLALCMRRPYFHVTDRNNNGRVTELPLTEYSKQMRRLHKNNNRMLECSAGSIVHLTERYGDVRKSITHGHVHEHKIVFHKTQDAYSSAYKQRRQFLIQLRDELARFLSARVVEPDSSALRRRFIPLDFLLFDAGAHSTRAHVYHSAADYLRHIKKMTETEHVSNT